MPIFNQSVWDTFWVNGEALYVYFDTSNRAKQLCQQFCSDPDEGRSVAFGLRFIVNYRGNEESIYKLMDEMAAVE